MPHRYPQPANEDEFEEFCLVLLREHWSLPTLDRYGHRGEEQHGVDLLDTGGNSPLRAVQCKHHDATKTLPPREVQAEVDKAKCFPAKLDEFYILTTAKKSSQAQRRVRAINEAHQAAGLFVVHLLTWDDVERIVADSPAGQEALGTVGPKVVRGVVRQELQPVLAAVRTQSDGLHGADLDEIKRYLDSKELQVAEALLGRLRKASWDQMSPRNRWRWCTLLADANCRQGCDAKAAQLLIEAKTYQPNDESAVANEIMAFELLGDRTRAYELAVGALPARPHSASIHAAAIRCAPSEAEFRRLFDGRPGHLRDHPEVWLAAAMRDDLEPSLEKAEDTARRATALAPDDPRSWFAVGSVLLRSELSKADPEDAPITDGPARRRIEEARDAFSKVVELTSRRGVSPFQASALVRRATALAHLGEDRKAHEDIDEARRIAPEEPAILMAAARVEEERGHQDEGVNLLRQVAMREPTNEEARFLLGISLWNRNVAGDRVEAIALLAGIGVEGTAHLEPANELAVEGMINLGRHTDAQAHLTKVAASMDQAFIATSRAYCEAGQGRSQEASVLATEGAKNISERTSRRTLRRLARLLMTLGRLTDALAVWERVALPSAMNDDLRSLVECAGRLERHGKVMEVCAKARASGAFDPFLLQSELRLLDRYNPDEALALLEEVIRRDASNKRARVHLVNLALRLGRETLAESHLEHLPRVDEAEAEEGAAVVVALAALGHQEDATAYAYDLLRRHFQDHHAHRAFRNVIMSRDHSGEPDELEVPTEVGPGVAVCLAEEGSPLQWVVLEDSSVPAIGVESEIAADSPLAKKLIGKRAGDEVALSEGPGTGRVVTVRELLPKLVFRVRDVMDRWQYRFPDRQEIWMMRFQYTAEGKPDFSSLIEMAKDQNRRQKKAESLYAEKSVPIWLFGRAVGKTEVFAVAEIAGTDGLVLRCCAGSMDEYAEASRDLKAASEVVLDLTSLSTLLLLDESGVLDLLGKNLIVSHSTLAGLRAFVDKARSHTQASSSMGANDEGPVLFVDTPERKKAALERVARFQRRVEEKCRVLGCPALADVYPEDRKLLEEGMGASALESVVLAASAGRVVWTDDAIVAVLGREKFGTKRIWTQGVFRWLNEQGMIANDRYALVSASLLGMQYMFTSVNPDVMRVAGKRAEWRPDRGPLKQALWYLALDGVRGEDAAFLSAGLISHCYVDALLPETRQRLLRAMADSLGQRTDGERVITLLRMHLREAFGFNAPGLADALATLESWRAAQRRPVTILSK